MTNPRLAQALDSEDVRLLLEALLTFRPRKTADWSRAGATARRLQDLRHKLRLLQAATLVHETAAFATYAHPEGSGKPGLMVLDLQTGGLHQTALTAPTDDQSIRAAIAKPVFQAA